MVVAIDLKTISSVNVDERKKLDIRAGDVVRVHQKIQEKGKTRIQMYEGLVLARKHGTEAGATFTVRATLSGVGVEKIFPLYSPMIDKIDIVRRSKVRRAKLYYIRDKVSREMRRQLRKMSLVSLTTGSDREMAEAASLAEAKAAEDAAAEEALRAEQAKASEVVDEAPIEVSEPVTPEEIEAAKEAS
ncbi:50S ribosomal protein L19 [Patescibacteria group bacterium]|nr:MAG: 50S ribosomal protein L19 [Patescibacteria group bacterium]